jgi:NCS1 family nucleobase:cation symporter-1
MSHSDSENEVIEIPGASPDLYNADLAPLKTQTWTQYNIFCYWMSDVHSVGGYIFAGSLFALGLTSWQVLIALLAGIMIVKFFCNLIAKPSQIHGVPYPVMCRSAFGVRGANIPAMIRGLIAVGWYGIQTYLASHAIVLLMLKFMPGLIPYADLKLHGFAGLSTVGWAAFLMMWMLQALVFWNGMETIKKFIDFAGPAVYVVMFILAGWLVYRAGWENLNFRLGSKSYEGWAVVPVMITSIALVAGYFAGPVLNFGDFSRYCKNFKEVKKGNVWGLPVNYLAFSIVTVVTTAATLPVFGRIITDPVEMVASIDSITVVVIGALTFVIATIGINIVANFVPSAFDFTNLAPSRISWRMGGMMAAVASIFVTPWNLFKNPEMIHYTIDLLGCAIGPLYGILFVDYYLVKRRSVTVEELYSKSPQGRYWYRNGVNPRAVIALIPASVIGLSFALIPALKEFANFSIFLAAGAAGLIYWLVCRSVAEARQLDAPLVVGASRS